MCQVASTGHVFRELALVGSKTESSPCCASTLHPPHWNSQHEAVNVAAAAIFMTFSLPRRVLMDGRWCAMQHGALIHTKNRQQVSPLEIAMKRGHFGCETAMSQASSQSNDTIIPSSKPLPPPPPPEHPGGGIERTLSPRKPYQSITI